MTRGEWPLLLDDAGLQRELTRLNLHAAAEHHPGQDGMCPRCGVAWCRQWMDAVEALRVAGVAVPIAPVCEPRRPQWWCERHDAPWPCAITRGLLSDAYGVPGRPALARYLAGRMVDAARECGDPADELVERFVTWVVRPW